MLTIINLLLDLLFPPRPSEREIRHLNQNNIGDLYRPGVHEGMIYLLPYQKDSVKALIQENKFYDNSRAATLLAQTLETWLKTQTAETIMLIPIPLSSERHQERGYNQVSHILEKVSTNEKVTVREDLLIRSKHTLPQTDLERSARLKNIAGAFQFIPPRIGLTQKIYVIVDDVTTTGATLRVAKAALTPHLPPYATVICLALAH